MTAKCHGQGVLAMHRDPPNTAGLCSTLTPQTPSGPDGPRWESGSPSQPGICTTRLPSPDIAGPRSPGHSPEIAHCQIRSSFSRPVGAPHTHFFPSPLSPSVPGARPAGPPMTAGRGGEGSRAGGPPLFPGSAAVHLIVKGLPAPQRPPTAGPSPRAQPSAWSPGLGLFPPLSGSPVQEPRVCPQSEAAAWGG